ncbi:hypothetical protein GCM10022630_37450 [Thermobifida alba]
MLFAGRAREGFQGLFRAGSGDRDDNGETQGEAGGEVQCGPGEREVPERRVVQELGPAGALQNLVAVPRFREFRTVPVQAGDQAVNPGSPL